MGLHFDFRFPEDPIVAYDPPGWCIDVKVEIRYPDGSSDDGAPDAEIDAIYFEGSFRGVTIWPGAWQAAIGNISRRSQWMLTPRLPLSRDLIQTIERRRAGSAPLQFKTKIMARAKTILQNGALGNVQYVPQRSEVVNSLGSLTLTIDRDKWAGILKKVGWAEIEVFEVEPGALGDDPAFNEAIAELRNAEDALRARTNPDYVLVDCFKALELIAKEKGAGDVAAGFKTLMAETFPKDPKKADLINTVIERVKTFAHFGRHEEVPPVNISFDEARFILTTTMGLMQLITTNNRSRQH